MLRICSSICRGLPPSAWLWSSRNCGAIEVVCVFVCVCVWVPKALFNFTTDTFMLITCVDFTSKYVYDAVIMDMHVYYCGVMRACVLTN